MIIDPLSHNEYISGVLNALCAANGVTALPLPHESWSDIKAQIDNQHTMRAIDILRSMIVVSGDLNV